ncbi:hypothetical protein ACVWW7_003941 [Bradyrhizobium sp. LM6.9]
MAARTCAHLDADDQARERGGNEPAEEEAERLAGGIPEQPELQDCGEKRDRAGRGHRRRAVTAECRAGRDLAADRHDVGQCLVEIAHWQRQNLVPPTLAGKCWSRYFVLQSI